jgi:hypothetical protein
MIVWPLTPLFLSPVNFPSTLFLGNLYLPSSPSPRFTAVQTNNETVIVYIPYAVILKERTCRLEYWEWLH